MNIKDNAQNNDGDLGGFDGQDDDSFALEHLEKYPGDLSKFNESAISLERSVESAMNTTETADPQPPTPTFQQSQEIQEEDVESDSHTATYRPALGEGESMQNVPFNRSGTIEDTADLSQFSSSRDSLERKDSKDTSREATHVFEKVDDQWVQLLKKDLERSQERKSSAANQSESQPEQNTKNKKAFTAVEDLGNTDEINLADIDAHHPSTYHQEELLVTPQPILESYPEDSVSSHSSYAAMAAEMAAASPEPPIEPVVPPKVQSIPKPVKPRNEKNRKRAFFFMVAAAAVAAVGFGAYRFYPDIVSLFEQNPPTTIAKHDTAVVHPTVKSTLHDTANAHGVATIDSAAKHEEQNIVASAEPPKHEEVKPIIPEKLKETPKPIVAPITKPEITAELPKTKPKPTEPLVMKPMMPSKSTAHNNTSVSPSQSTPTLPVFTVQVYSSPSKDDATERLERLKSRNAANISMSEQLIRGKTWYRVRFGSFNSRDEAETAAKQLGFAQCWIDRVR
jgi:hypothetical protein